MSKQATKRNLTDDSFEDAAPDSASISAYEQKEDNVHPQERGEVLAAINYVAGLSEDWDNNGAVPPHKATVEMSRAFIERLPLNRLYPDKVAPDGEGGITFTWYGVEGHLIVTVDGSRLHLSYIGADTTKNVFKDNIVFDGEIIPMPVKDRLPIRSKSRS
jgi:hypothetical protein